MSDKTKETTNKNETLAVSGRNFAKAMENSRVATIGTLVGAADSVSVKHGARRLSSRKVVISITEIISISNFSAQLKNGAVYLERIL